jgi:hypothetical protein
LGVKGTINEKREEKSVKGVIGAGKPTYRGMGKKHNFEGGRVSLLAKSVANMHNVVRPKTMAVPFLVNDVSLCSAALVAEDGGQISVYRKLSGDKVVFSRLDSEPLLILEPPPTGQIYCRPHLIYGLL